MQSIHIKIAGAALFSIAIPTTAEPAIADDNSAACNTIEALLEDLYQVPYGVEDFTKLKPLNASLRASAAIS